MRLYDAVRGSRKGRGRRVVVVERVVESEVVRIVWRGLAKDDVGRRVSDVSEGISFLARKILHPIEGVWEGELIPGARGRVVEYNNRRYEPPRSEGEAIMPAASRSKGKAGAAKGRGAAAKAKSNGGGERATEAQLDKLSAQVVKLRDTQGKSWTEVCETLDIQPSRARQLYNRGGGEPTRQRASSGGGKGKAAASKGKRGRGRPAKNPS
jgi:hypothetical protein